jgi:aldehyde:ferredoxin oxidoreductase
MDTLEKGIGPGAGNGGTGDFTNIDAKTQIAIWMDDRAMVKDSLLLCDWAFPRLYGPFPSSADFNAATNYLGDVDAEAKMYAPLTGLKVTTADIHKAGERVRNLERALHVKLDGRNRAMDTLMEPHFERPEKTDGTYLNLATFNTIVDSYYARRGWDKTTGWPTRAKLESLDLKDVADGLAAAGKPPP